MNALLTVGGTYQVSRGDPEEMERGRIECTVRPILECHHRTGKVGKEPSVALFPNKVCDVFPLSKPIFCDFYSTGLSAGANRLAPVYGCSIHQTFSGD